MKIFKKFGNKESKVLERKAENYEITVSVRRYYFRRCNEIS